MDESVRISKRMAELGMCSRREADSYIEKGWVRVDGEIAVLGQKVLSYQQITINQQASKAIERQVTILLNKPVGYVSSQAEDGYTPAMSLITHENRWEEDESHQRFSYSQLKKLAPAGRLDIDSVGLIVYTQDGRIAKQLIGEDSEIEKEYLVRVEGNEIKDALKWLNHGLSLDGELLKPAEVFLQNHDQLRFILKQGKKRQIRRMCEMVGLHVTGLKRVRIGNIMLGHLPQGQWRYLLPSESF